MMERIETAASTGRAALNEITDFETASQQPANISAT
jgi:hypothetical protein